MNEHAFSTRIGKTKPLQEELNKRQCSVLNEVCEAFITSGLPVGSRTISKSNRISCSPATIRNEMSDLELMGYLYSPHTSAGRVPTEKGYKFYVNFLIQYDKVSQIEDSLIKQIVKKSSKKFVRQQDIIKSAIKYACKETNLMGIALTPQKSAIQLKSIKLFRVLEDKAMLVLVDEMGTITDKLVRIPADTSDKTIELLSTLLNAQLCHEKYHQFEQNYIAKTRALLSKHNSLLTKLASKASLALSKNNEDSIMLDGFANFFDQPEFNSSEKMKTMLKLLDKKEILLKLLAQSLESDENIMVNIGTESGLEAKDLSLVTAKYSGPNNSLGQIGIIGPLRMDYGRVVATLAHLSSTLSKLLIGKQI